MIQITNLTKQYGPKTVVSSVSFGVAPGETLVLAGTSGCGKTTTLKMLNRLVEPTSGTVLLNGQNVQQADAPTLRRGIGYVMQEAGLFPHYTVSENIGAVPRLLGWDPDRIRTRTHELMDLLRLPTDLLNRYPADLSGGQRQRVGLARALAVRPPVVLMDEPFGALDPYTRRHVRREVFGISELQETTVVLVTHDVTEALELGDRIALMDAGELVQIGPPRDLTERPVNAFVRDFFTH
ncbi:MAG: ABC transporter ATP-binding protein [Cytophagales bacterium]|nr:MAG: ABC transporter ATP-binding protein [Cytophagales bacterium]